MSDRPSVLFVCVHNAGRSQMAAGFFTAAVLASILLINAGKHEAEAAEPSMTAPV